MENLGAAVIGAGYWGPNLIRNLQGSSNFDLKWVCDLDADRAARVVGRYSTIRTTTRLEDVLADDSVAAVAVATPARTHRDIAGAALEAGKHVLVEKPLAMSYREGQELVDLAAANDRVLFCDHTYCYTPAVQRIRELVHTGELGDIQYVDSVRINLGLVQRDTDVLWDLAPHDLSILDFILPEDRMPLAVAAHGADPIGAGRACVAYLTLPLQGNAIAHAHVNWLSPTKVRTTIIGGSKKTLVWDDLNPSQRICIYDRGVDLTDAAHAEADERREAMVSYRAGDMIAPALKEHEALGAAIAEFVVGHPRAASGRDVGRSRPPGARHPGGGVAQPRVRRRRRAAEELPMIAGARVLITGGSGMIGSTIADQVLDRGAAEVVIIDNFVRGRLANLESAMESGRLTIVEGDIRDRGLLAEHMKDIDVLFHQAAIRITQCAEEPRLALEVLVDGTYNVLEAAVEAEVRRVVAASSASVYGLAESFPTTESHHPYANDTFYGAAKTFNESMLRSFHSMYGLDYVALRYFNVYGPRMDVHGVYTEVLVRWMERIARGERPLILGDGSQTMDFVHVADVARANVLAAESSASDEVFNVASGTETSLLQLARLLLDVTGSDLDPEFGPERSVNKVSRRLADTSAARSRIGFEAGIDLAAGLAGLVEWWQAEQASAVEPVGARADEHHPGRQAVLRRGGGGGDGRRRGLGLGRAGSARRRVRARLRGPDRHRSRRRRVVVHRRPAPRAGPRRCRAGGRDRRPVPLVHRHRQRRPLRRRHPGVRRRRRGDAEPDPGDRRGGALAGDEGGRARPPGRHPGRRRRSARDLRSTRPGHRRGRRLRGGLDVPGPARRRRSLGGRVLVPPPQGDHHR